MGCRFADGDIFEVPNVDGFRFPKPDETIESRNTAVPSYLNNRSRFVGLAMLAVLAGCAQQSQTPAQPVAVYNPPGEALAALPALGWRNPNSWLHGHRRDRILRSDVGIDDGVRPPSDRAHQREE